jgi:hypothetical protein
MEEKWKEKRQKKQQRQFYLINMGRSEFAERKIAASIS